MVRLLGDGAGAGAPGQARATKENRTRHVSPDWAFWAMGLWGLKERMVVRLKSAAAHESVWEQTYYSRRTRRHGLGHSCSPLTRYYWLDFSTVFAASDALALPGMLRRFKTLPY
jgi:hypothetical protein